MQDPKLIPNPLINPQEKKKITIVREEKLSFFLSLSKKIAFFFEVIYLLNLHLLSKILSSNKSPQIRRKKAQIIRRRIENQGGFWIRLGKLFSLRVDLFSQEFCQELSFLKDRSYAFPFDQVKEVIEKSYQVPLEHLFDHFEEIPFSVTSIGQIHSAFLRREKMVVAVKVQRPGIEKQFKRDMALILKAIRFCEIFSIYPRLDWEDVILELKQVLTEELDYRLEVTSVDQMKKKLKRHNIYVPSFYPQYSTQRVMIMELIRGVRISDFIETLKTNPDKVKQWLRNNNVCPKKVAKRLVLSIYRQMFEDNLFHANLHPDNIVFLRDSSFAFIDFGGVGILEKGAIEKIKIYCQAISEQNYSEAADYIFFLSPSLPLIDLQEIKRKLLLVYRNWELRTLSKELSYNMRSLTCLTEEIIATLKPHNITMEASFLHFNHVCTLLDLSLIHLHPKLSYPKLMRSYFRKAAERSRKKRKKEPKMPKIMQLNREMQEISEKISKLTRFQLDKARHSAQIFQMTLSKGAFFSGTLMKSVALAFRLSLCLLVYSVLYKHNLWVTSYHLGWLTEIALQIAQYSIETWCILFLSNLYFLRTSSNLAKKMVAKDTRTNTHIPKD